MKIYGVGTDVLELARMHRLWERWGERAERHILTARESERFARARDRGRFLGMHFAAKEAVTKALGTGFCPRMTLHDVEVIPDRLGRPEVYFSDKGAAFVAERGGGETHISLTDDAGIVFAVCVMLVKD
ncbi:MAG TPA: holo-ACP synthase [Gammaproteobacteria bacterium]|nr:holo-ACP synthase [Gammaproteobacteria bacterium]